MKVKKYIYPPGSRVYCFISNCVLEKRITSSASKAIYHEIVRNKVVGFFFYSKYKVLDFLRTKPIILWLLFFQLFQDWSNHSVLFRSRPIKLQIPSLSWNFLVVNESQASLKASLSNPISSHPLQGRSTFVSMPWENLLPMGSLGGGG